MNTDYFYNQRKTAESIWQSECRCLLAKCREKSRAKAWHSLGVDGCLSWFHLSCWNTRLLLVELLGVAGSPLAAGAHAEPQRGVCSICGAAL